MPDPTVDSPEKLQTRHPTAEDHGRVLAVLDEWWGGSGGVAGSQQRALLLPRLYFQHFTDTSYLVERADGRLAAFLVGFLSPAHPDVAYIHVVGVDPALHRSGVARGLYTRFFEDVAPRGARSVRCITSPGNSASLAFHNRLGFAIEPSQTLVEGVAVQRDYDGPGLDRVAFTRSL